MSTSEGSAGPDINQSGRLLRARSHAGPCVGAAGLALIPWWRRVATMVDRTAPRRSSTGELSRSRASSPKARERSGSVRGSGSSENPENPEKSEFRKTK